MNKPTFKQAEWVALQIGDTTPDDVYDVMLGNITRPESLVADVQYYALIYTEQMRAGNAKIC